MRRGLIAVCVALLAAAVVVAIAGRGVAPDGEVATRSPTPL
jgi:hypothetical protein